MTSMVADSADFTNIFAFHRGIRIILGLTSDIYGPFSQFSKYLSKWPKNTLKYLIGPKLPMDSMSTDDSR